MKTLKTLTQLSTVLCLLGLLCTGKAQAEDISGPLQSRKRYSRIAAWSAT